MTPLRTPTRTPSRPTEPARLLNVDDQGRGLDDPVKRYLGDVAQADPDRPDFSGADDARPADEAELDYLDSDYGFDDEDEEGELIETIDAQGRRHIRRAAPEGTEQILENEAPRHTGLPDRAERWRVRSATGTVLTAFAFGLKEVFEPDRNQPAIIMETSGDPPRDLPVEAQLEQLGPRQSSVMVRSWLLGNNLPGSSVETEGAAGPADAPATATPAKPGETATAGKPGDGSRADGAGTLAEGDGEAPR